MPLNPNVPEGLKNPRFELGDAEMWMTVPPSFLQGAVFVTAVVVFLVLVGVLRRRRDREGGWTLLAFALPHLLLSFVFFLANALHMMMIMIFITPYRDIFAGQLEVAAWRFLPLLLAGFGWGFVALWTGLWLILPPPKKPLRQHDPTGMQKPPVS